jgi:hypothetical protein
MTPLVLLKIYRKDKFNDANEGHQR